MRGVLLRSTSPINDRDVTVVPAPKRPRQLTHKELGELYPIACRIDPAAHSVIVARAWTRENLKAFQWRPGLAPVLVHKDAWPHFEAWRQLIASANLLDRIVTSDGGFVPRLMRGANVPATVDGLSRHTRGIALDINALTNRRGTRGARPGEPGCVHELVPLAYECGIVWGGDWLGAQCDAMHFEIGRRRY